jgi:hypothetical protein
VLHWLHSSLLALVWLPIFAVHRPCEKRVVPFATWVFPLNLNERRLVLWVHHTNELPSPTLGQPFC